MLYELLAGHLSSDPAEVGLHQFLARLARWDTSPPTPSVGLPTAAALRETIARRRRTDARHLKRELRGDVDWIVMKAMYPDRSRGLAAVNRAQKRSGEADSLWKATLQRQERSFGSEQPDVGSTLNNIGAMAYSNAKYADADAYYGRARPILERAYSAEHPPTVSVIKIEVEVLWKLKRYAEAEPLFRQALAAKKRLYTPEHSSIAVSLNGLAGVLRDSKREAEAEVLYKRALVIREIGNGSADMSETPRDYAVLLRATNRAALAEQFEARAAALK